MIYKFYDRHENSNKSDTLEFFSTIEKDLVVFEAFNSDVGTAEIHLNKDDIYKLIGALHLLHKEMK